MANNTIIPTPEQDDNARHNRVEKPTLELMGVAMEPVPSIASEGMPDDGRLAGKNNRHEKTRCHYESAAKLQGKIFDPIKWAIPGLIAEGLVISRQT